MWLAADDNTTDLPSELDSLSLVSDAGRKRNRGFRGMRVSAGAAAGRGGDGGGARTAARRVAVVGKAALRGAVSHRFAAGAIPMDDHMPVLVEESLAALALEADGFYVDATFGRGGHTARILEALGGEGRGLALDRDAAAIAAGRARFANEMRLALVHAPFADLATLVPPATQTAARAAVCSSTSVSPSPQLDDPARGFSLRADGPLDMRMDATRGEPVSAAARLRGTSTRFARGDRHAGEERFAEASRRGDRERAVPRRRSPGLRSLQELVSRAVRTREPGKHPPPRTFQALRMFINDELGQL